ncbi:MAG: YafY family transcriptional regulator [Spirochaetales bacterium]|nr:YafY family transcriptional regulator [Spirochaetales bacterium]
MKKIERLLTIVLALKRNGKMTASEIANIMEVNIRTVYRDMDALSQMEVPVISSHGADGGYEIMEDYFLPAVSFTSDEILALQIGKKLLDKIKIPGFSPNIESAFLKLDNTTNSEQQKQNKKVLNRIFFNLVNITPSMERKAYFEHIRIGMAENRTLKISYYSPKKLSESDREIEPRVLTYHEGGWYLIAYCRLRKAERTFRLDRILKLQLTENIYSLPADFDFGQYDKIESYRRDVLKKNEGTRIILKVAQPLLERDKDNLLLIHYDIKVEDGWGFWEVNTNYPEEFISYAIENSPDVEILEPETLRQQLKEKLIKIINQY